jgi:hypothetical protein
MEDAQQFLAMSDGILESAVALFFETGSLSAQQPGGGISQPTPQARADADEDMDAALAASLAAEDEANKEEQIRAPDQAFNDQMLGGAGAHREVPQHVDQAPELKFGGDDTEGDSGAFKELFKPPAEILCEEPFSNALETAKNSQRWLLVNLQDTEDFTSHVLNRDVWRDDTISSLVGASFVFWQRLATSPEGQQFMQYYSAHCSMLPVICVIDPRTGRAIKSWDAKRWKEAHSAAEFLSDFLDSHSFDRRPSNFTPLGSPNVGPSSSPAMQPMSSPNGGPAMHPPLDDMVLSGLPESDSASSLKRKSTDEAPAEPPKPAVPELPPYVEPEDGGVDVVKVSFKLPSGERQTKRFVKSDTLETVFNVVAGLTSQAPTAFDLEAQFPRRSMRELGLTVTVGAADIAGSMLMCRNLPS